jgi:hypothetical protein
MHDLLPRGGHIGPGIVLGAQNLRGGGGLPLDPAGAPLEADLQEVLDGGFEPLRGPRKTKKASTSSVSNHVVPWPICVFSRRE